MASEELIFSILGLLGISGVIGGSFTYLWDRQKERANRENELKETRYKSIILLMYTLINPGELEKLQLHRPDINDIDELKRELQTEWVNSWLFAGDQTILNLKEFLRNPNETTFVITVFSMRMELWNKRSKLSASEFALIREKTQ